jgi:SAM-dependent methyltransferase
MNLENLVCRTRPGYRAYLRLKHGAGAPSGRPVAPWQNTTLKSRSEVDHALAQVRKLGLVDHETVPKNWDALAALAVVLDHTNPSSVILDAGAEFYSSLLPSLSLYGYEHLVAINLGFHKPIRRGPIRYEPGDITKTRFEPETFDAITCLSVIEHGVDLARYFREMARILKPGGFLITSTDYWPQTVETGSASAYGCPVKIFTAQEIQSALDLAQRSGFELTGPVDLDANEKAVRWAPFDLDFTFVIFCLRKRTCAGNHGPFATTYPFFESHHASNQ